MKFKTAVLLTLSITAILFFNMGWNSSSAYTTDSQIQNSILYVKPAVTGTTCSSWTDPCKLQAALDIATDGDQIWVVEGTYNPTVPAGREATFQLISGVAIYGGFIGNETSLSERDWETNVTTLSGDIGSEGDDTDNSYHVVTGSGTDSTAILDGFTINAGNANGALASGFDNGGGMYNESGSPSLTNVAFTSNFGTSGGGMYNYLSNPSLTNVSFVGNNANFGGGMYNAQSNPNLSNVSFTNNLSQGDGGGMYNISSNPSLSFVEFSLNNAAVWGGGMNNQSSHPVMSQVTFDSNEANYGGGVSNTNSSPTLDYATFNLNTAIVGGGMLNTGNSNPSISNTTFSDNFASDVGGGMRNSGSDPLLFNVNFSGNIAINSGGGMINVSDSHPILNNVLFSGNTAVISGGAVYNEDSFPILSEVLFSNNTATGDFGSGGGMSNVYSSPTLTNVTFSGNSAVYYGGGMVNDDSSPTMTNITFIGNSAGNGGGMANLFSSTKPVVTNSILWGNTPDQIFNQPLSTVTITYSDVQGGWAGTGNINADPLLGPLADNGGFTLTHALGEGSPAIDSGDPNPDNCPATDQRGFPRPIDGDGVDGPRCDMGAYEYEVVMQIDFPIYLPMIVR